MVERNVKVDHVTIWRWVQRYAPELHRRCGPELRVTNRSWRDFGALLDYLYAELLGNTRAVISP